MSTSKYVLIIVMLQFAACGTEDQQATSQEDTLIIATAANAQFAIKEIETLFESTYNTDITIITGSSGKLTAQIKQGAPYDMLIAANMKYPEQLYKEGFTTTSPSIYAQGRLVLWTTSPHIKLDSRLHCLTLPDVQKISIANPKNAPYGEEAVHALQHFGLYETLSPKLVYGESIAQATQFVLTQNCDIGITAKAMVNAPNIKHSGRWIDIPNSSYNPIHQSVVITKYGEKNHPQLAKKFFELLFSPPAQKIFKKYGYALPTKN